MILIERRGSPLFQNRFRRGRRTPKHDLFLWLPEPAAHPAQDITPLHSAATRNPSGLPLPDTGS